MRYYIKCKLNTDEKQRLTESIKSGSLARGKIFYEGMQTALREGTIDENNIVHFVEICYCLEGGLYLEKLIEAKFKGQEIVAKKEEEEPEETTDIIEALKASLKVKPKSSAKAKER